MRLPAVVLDCGTGYTKMGFAGNVEVISCSVCLLLIVCNFANFQFYHVNLQPSMTIPTVMGVRDYASKPSYRATGLEDLDFHIGHDALANSATYSVSYPVRHGMVGLVLSNSFCLQNLSVIGRLLP